MKIIYTCICVNNRYYNYLNIIRILGHFRYPNTPRFTRSTRIIERYHGYKIGTINAIFLQKDEYHAVYIIIMCYNC